MSFRWNWHRQQHLVPPAVKPCPHAAPLRQSLQHQQRGSQHSQMSRQPLVSSKEGALFIQEAACTLIAGPPEGQYAYL